MVKICKLCNLKNNNLKIIICLLLFFSINSYQLFAITIKRKTDNKQLITQINQYIIHHNSTEKKIHSAHSTVKLHTHKVTLLNAMEGSGSSPWSNAFNFQKELGTQIDPRTGTLTAYVKTGDLISNLDHGPNINLQVNYNSSSIANPDDLGRGWSWNLTHFNLANNQLATSQGQNFSLQEDKLGHWWPRYHKLKDMQINGDKKTHFSITYINGLREILNHDGYEIRLEQQDGKGVNFSYVPGTHLLSMISDDLGHKIVLTRKNDYLTVTSYNSAGKPVNIRISFGDDELQSVTLSNDKRQDEQGIYIRYSTFSHLLTQFVYPTGLTKNIRYDCHQAVKMPLIYGEHEQGLCVVTTQVVDPGMAQPAMVTHYTYDQTNSNEHNYLGFNADLDIIPDKQEDILFEAPSAYTYQTKEDNGFLQTVRTYNKYHLLIDIKLFSDKTKHLLAETHNFFCRTDRYDGCAHTSFENLPATYTLPLKMETYTWGESSGPPAIDITQQSFDHSGRMINATDTYGRRETIRYCPVQGDKFCPAEPSGWSLNVLTESITHYPSYKVAGGSQLPVMTVDNYYKKESNINGQGYILVLAKQVSQSGHQQNTTIRQYYNNNDNYMTYGLLKKIILTGKEQSDVKPTTLTRTYHYMINADNTTKTIYSTFEEGSDQSQRSPSVTVSLFTHQTLQTTDASGKNITRYHYDNLGRLIQADSAVGTSFAVSKNYYYTVSSQLNQVIVTNANGLQQKIVFDSAGRKLENFDEMIDAYGKAKHNQWQLTGNITYDANGHVAATHVYNYYQNSPNHPQLLTTTYDYTATGRLFHKHLPDGETIVDSYDDPDRCMISYTLNKKGNHSVISVIHGNILDKPVKQILLPESESLPLSTKQYCTTGSQLTGAKITTVTYDGYGRKIASTDPDGKTVVTHYDNRGHVSEIIDPSGNKIHNVYNFIGKVIKKWVEPAKDHHQYLLFSAQYNVAGEPIWRAGEDGKRTTYTYTRDGKIDTVTTPAGNIIAYQYNVLGLPVSKWLNGKLLTQMYYNPLTTKLIKMTDNTGTTTWNYNDDGKVQQLIHHSKDNQSVDYKISWAYDSNGNVIAMTNPSGQKTKTTYDHFERIRSISYQMNNGKEQLLSAPVYGAFSRVVAIKYGSGMERSIEYNNDGQQKNVVDMLSGKQLSAWQYRYDTEGNITTLVNNGQNHQQAVLNYHYDTLDNLVSVTCTGSPGLPLCPRDTHFKGSGLDKAPIITRQDYTFNALNRMTQVKEVLTDATQQKTLNKVVNYDYGDVDAPLRLQKISTQWNNKSFVANNFAYDITGNMITDGEGNHMIYNAFNQITHVMTLDGKQSRYIYDGSGREVKTVTGTGDVRYMFYIGKSRVGEQTEDLQHNQHIITPLGVAKAIDGVIHEYYEQNYKGDVTGILTKNNYNDATWTLNQHTVYSPYGMAWHNHSIDSQPLYFRTLIGFDGEQHDPVTGWQFLGAGHRTYNAAGRYFVSEDPAGDGYAFGSNNPIMHTDPSGNIPKWVGSAMHIMNYVGTLGMAALHKKWANTVGTALMVTLSTIAVGIGLAAGGATPLVIAGGMGLSFSAGSVSIAAAAVPANKGLNIANAVVGAIQMAVAVASVGLALAYGARALFFPERANFLRITSAAMSKINGWEEEGSSLPFSTEGDNHLLNSSYDQQDDIPTLKPSVGVLKELLPDYIENDDEQAVLHVRTVEGFVDVIKKLRNSFNISEFTGEDSLFIMLTYATHMDKSINLDNLSSLLEAAGEGADEETVSAAYTNIMGDKPVNYEFGQEGLEKNKYGIFIKHQNLYDDYIMTKRVYIKYNEDNNMWSGIFFTGWDYILAYSFCISEYPCLMDSYNIDLNTAIGFY